MERRRGGRAVVVVLGDIGRSPRMQYHALSLALQGGFEVDIVANGGTDPHMAIINNPSIHLHVMRTIQLRALTKISSAVALLFKALFQFSVLIWYLCFKIPRPDVFIVQNPPSVPTLAAVKLASWIRQSRFIVDWHNFGYTLLALSLGRSNLIVKVYRWFEFFFGRMSDGSLCVTKAMQHELAQNWGIKAVVLYDQPPEFFRPISLEEKHELFCRLEKDLDYPKGVHDCLSTELGLANFNKEPSSETVFSIQKDNRIMLKPHRPVLVVSSTSWTPDEDFGLLLEAAVMYDRRVAAALKEDDLVEEEKLWTDIQNGKTYSFPRLLFIITGKGPEKQNYEERIKRLKLRRVAFRTMWLSAEDYPLLLGSADLGVCLHTSSSGLDLPMKVVDMFGCGLPVCAVSFSCIEELVKVEQNGLLFSSSSELADELLLLFRNFPDKCDALTSLRESTTTRGSSSRWSSEWEKHALPLIHEILLRDG